MFLNWKKDSYLFLVLTALPWCGRILEKNQSAQLNQIMEKIDIYISSRDKTHNDILRVWRTDTPLPQEDMIESCWKQVSNMAKAYWFELILLIFKCRPLGSKILITINCCKNPQQLKSKTIKRIAGTIMITYHGHIVLLKVFSKRLNVNHCHHLLFHPILMKLHIQNHMLFSDFSKQKIAIQKTKDHYCPELILLLDLLVIIFIFYIYFLYFNVFFSKNNFSVEENLFQILLTYYRERKECASKLLSYYNKDKVPLFHMIVECMFGSMFRLPDSPTIDIGN